LALAVLRVDVTCTARRRRYVPRVTSPARPSWGTPLGFAIGLLILVAVLGGLALSGAISSRVALFGIAPALGGALASALTVLVLRRRAKSRR